uniref:BTB domain-containing protein n=1 Tax=Oryza punctata TaxID=4537 RepID=A0A0E0M7V8_ORYPU
MGASASSSGERRRCGAAIVADTVCEHFDLTIDGYSHIKAMLPTGKCATSPPFSAGGHEWCVDYYPNGKLVPGDAHMIQFFLRLHRAKAKSAAVVAQVRFDLLGDDGNPQAGVCSGTGKVLSFTVNGRGQNMVIKRDAFEQAGCAKDDRFTVRFAVTVFRGCRTAEAPGRRPRRPASSSPRLPMCSYTCTVNCQTRTVRSAPTRPSSSTDGYCQVIAPPMSSPSSQPASAIKAATTSGYHRLKIDYYRCLASPNGWALSSRNFVVGGRQWRISYYPNGNRPENSEFISVFLYLDRSAQKPAALQMSITFDDEVKKQSRLHKAPVITLSPGACWGYHRFVKRDDLARSKRIKPDGFFTIRCDVSLIDHFMAQDEPVFVSVPPSELRRHLGDLLDTGKGGDVVFQVGGEAFTAHRCLLAARSPVLAAALYSAMMEGDGHGGGGVAIKIDDMDPLVFKALLSYAYTDSLPPQMQQGEEGEGRAMAQHLLAAADRYGMERLRLLCEAQLCKHIDVPTVASILILADQHGCSGLKNACFEFLKGPGKFAAAMATQEYDYLKTNHGALADEVVKVLASQL